MAPTLNKQEHLEFPCPHFKAGKGARIAVSVSLTVVTIFCIQLMIIDNEMPVCPEQYYHPDAISVIFSL